jgi:hypothetical protein
MRGDHRQVDGGMSLAGRRRILKNGVLTVMDTLLQESCSAQRRLRSE